MSLPLYLSQTPRGQSWERARYYGELLSPYLLRYYGVDKNKRRIENLFYAALWS